jgi:FG-GAP repeat protein
VVLAGEAANDWFGNSVAAAGDVNGDGYADVIVGAPYNDRGGSAAGAAYIFLGGRSMDAIPDAVLVGEIHDDQFGWSVAGAGDFNGDGFSDVIVGARLHCVDQVLCTGDLYARGRAYIYFGGASLPGMAGLVLDGDAANDWFGNTVAGIGDVNGDAYDDVAVGAIYADPVVGGVALSAAGTTNIYEGGASPDAARDGLVAGEQPDDQAGWAIAEAGDVDGDGRGDFWSTAHFYNDGATTGAGKVYLLGGGHPPPRWPLATFIGEGMNVQMGQSVAGGRVSGTAGLGAGILGQVYSRDVGYGSGKAFVISPFCLELTVSGASFDWASCSPFGAYEVYRGNLHAGSGTTLDPGCLLSGVTSTTAPMDPALPAAGDVFFYLVTGRLGSIEGALGFDSYGAVYPNPSPCP